VTVAGDRAAGLALMHELLSVSRETVARLDRYADLLCRWQRAKNLVAPSTLDTLWTRHFADSAQVVELAPTARRWVDLGSGAGFPGLVAALMLADVPGVRVDLVEANARKCAFLRAVVRETGAPAHVHAERIDGFLDGLTDPVDVITARALAPLSELVAMTAQQIRRGALGIFHKGADLDVELATATTRWDLRFDRVPSRTGACGALLILRDCAPKSA
jgi:16S rRNA (guanine527-N7)-methyltransferase